MSTCKGLILLSIFISSFCLGNCAYGFGGGGEKVLLSNVNVLTLHEGQMTQGRRSSPVPQLECIDKGTASCYSYRPTSVQCVNRGSDGSDAQWECKSDMDKEFKFGWIEVTCEGYDYPDDPYVLKGSCGLRYSLDYAHGSSEHHQPQYKNSFSNRIADFVVYLGIGLAIYAFYVTCLKGSNHQGQTAHSTTNDDYPNDDSQNPGRRDRGDGYGWFGGGNAHRQDYRDDASCGARHNRYGGGGGGGGFWTGAATGGLLGYMFGNRGGGNRYGYQPGYGGGGGGGWYGGGGGGGGFGRSSGTHTSSGFGGTSRR